MPKRWSNLYKEIVTTDNINLADDIAQQGKHNIGIIKHNKVRDKDNEKLCQSLINHTYKTSPYKKFTIYEPKERIIFKLPYYPDRITHHAIMNVMENKWKSIMISSTYACLKDRGIHALAEDIKKDLRKDVNGTVYCLKLDIHKFYPSINHEVLKRILTFKIKDKELLNILYEIIDSAEGVPIGNYLSQYFANIYLTYYDHWIKEILKVKYYYRYCDDMVLLSNSKQQLRDWFYKIKEYLSVSLKLTIKGNWQIFPVEARGIDFVGYRFYHTHTLLRTSIKKRINKLTDRYMLGTITKKEYLSKMSSYYGWLKHCDSHNYLYHIECKTGIKFSAWDGIKSKISKFFGANVYFVEKIDHKSYFEMHFVYKGKPYTVNSKSKKLKKTLDKAELLHKH